jgi:ABC-type multidrug transport system fused ATPase/permease subunit
MQNWFDYLKAGLARPFPKDKLADENKGGEATSHLHNLHPYLARHWRTGLAGAGLIFFVSVLSFPQPLINRFLVDDVVLARQLDLLPLTILLIGGVKLLSMAAGAMQQFYFTRFEQDVMRDLQRHLLDHALSLPKSFFDEKEVGYLISRLSSDVMGLRWFFSSNIIHIISSLFRFIGGIIFLFYLEWRLGIVTLVVLPVLVCGTRYFSERMRALSHHGMEQYASVTQRFQETLASVPLIKAFTSEKRESVRVMSAVTASQQIEMEQVTVNSLANLTLGIVPSLAGGVVLVAGAYWVIKGEWTLGSLLAFQSYLGYVYGPAMSLSNANLQLQDAMTALERVSAVLDIVPEESPGLGQVVEHLKGDVRFEDVSFSYPGHGEILENVSFSVRNGEHVAIVGPSGVGKTTLISLILRFYRPSSGEIFFDDLPAAEYELKSLRQRIGYVSQFTTLLAGTLRENLSYGNPQAPLDEIEKAARVAGIHDFIMGLPEGYNALVGERGINLSEGQKQRLSIARALIKDPDILILDEPTSALDTVTENSFIEAMKSATRGRTLFLIAHRLTTVKNVDRILVLNEKRLVAIGSHRELLQTSEYYRTLVANQQVLVSD